MPDYDFEFSTIKKVSCFHTQCEKNLHNSGIWLFPNWPRFSRYKTDRVSSETCCSMQHYNGHNNAVCYVLVHTYNSFISNTYCRNTCLPSHSSETCRTNNSPFDYFNRKDSGYLTIMSRPKLHPRWSPWKLRFLQIPLNIKCLSAYFYWSHRCILHQECLIP